MNDQTPTRQSIYAALTDNSTGTVAVVASGENWRELLADHLARSPGDAAIVVVEHRLRPLVVGLLRGRLVSRRGVPTVQTIRNQLSKLGWNVIVTYRLWPSATQPRVAIPIEPRTVAAWMQRNGLIGGGSSGWVRLVLRRRWVLPILEALAGGTAMEVRSPKGEGTL